jgi:ATP-dependent DNA helicase DinG
MTAETTQSAIDRWIAPAAQIQMREAIAEYDGAEVFFLGRIGPSRAVEEAEPRAFGNEAATPVIERDVRPGDVVIHNHPGGDLTPSGADVELASRFGNMGVGTYIVDNAVERVRVVVPAMVPRDRRPLDPVYLGEVLGPSGPLARSMPGYEHRPQQIEMLRTVADAFNDDGIAAIEAGTGTGKSLAYLLPAIHWAKTNGERVLVSTNTINLQEQLITKDLPFLQKHLGLEFEAELMKGRGNYLCLRRAGYLRRTPDFFADPLTVSQLEAILEWAAKTKDGSLSDLAFVPDADAWDQVACDGDNCPRVKCLHYGDCFFYQARRRAAKADLIVSNHHLVMADLALRLESNNYTATAVLPPYQRVVFDEAHNIEEVATHYFGIRITRRTLSRLLNRLVHRERSNQGLLPFLTARLSQVGYDTSSDAAHRAAQQTSEELIPLRRRVAESLSELLDLCAAGVGEMVGPPSEEQREMQLRVTPEVEATGFWSNRLRRTLAAASDDMARLAKGLRQVLSSLKKIPQDAREEFDNPAGELNSLANRLAGRANELNHFYSIGENRCRWIEVSQSRSDHEATSVRLLSLPLEVRESLHHAIYAKTATVVMTSATLTVDRRFDFFLDRVGLGEGTAHADTRERVVTLHLGTPFDFERQAFIGVPLDMPEPRAPGFTKTATEFLLPALQISRGSAFVLFTSYKQLRAFHGALAPLLRSLGYSCLRQGDESRQALLERFKNDRTSILFATSSFWEGVDVPGDALRLLVLVKLPFRVPTDPLMQARVEQLEAIGVDSFAAYAVPQAVIKFKQGFGRLIRKRDDYGAVLVLDRRVATKRYGQVFLNSLPSETIHQKPAHEILADLRQFFDKVPGERQGVGAIRQRPD